MLPTVLKNILRGKAGRRPIFIVGTGTEGRDLFF
jgi:hypothetical protein